MRNCGFTRLPEGSFGFEDLIGFCNLWIFEMINFEKQIRLSDSEILMLKTLHSDTFWIFV